jgi:hypothetical protein
VKLHDRWYARIAVVLALILYLFLPERLTLGPTWVAPLVIGCLLIALVAFSPSPRFRGTTRALSIGMIAALNVLNIISEVLLVYDLLNLHAKNHGLSATELIRYGGQVWATNVIVFALWYWELDSDGPFAREACESSQHFSDPDFLFPQMQIDRSRVKIPAHWKPNFVDYIYVSFTNALAVSPTDTMPLSRWAKMLMLVQSLISFTTVALILARSVNILS